MIIRLQNLVVFLFTICGLVKLNCSALCGNDDFKCKDGSCISLDDKCNGFKDCKDGSDEITEHCLDLKCPTYSYRCAYGACVNGEAECNGIKDCVDNSDELSPRCEKNIGNQTSDCRLVSTRPDMFKCANQKCINLDQVCDGHKQCSDGSDEQPIICSGISCPKFAFRCSYGACIGGDAKCDGYNDCADGSDESNSDCGVGHITNVPDKKIEAVTISKVIPGSCHIEVDLLNTVVSYESNPAEKVAAFGYVDNYAKIVYTCMPKYALVGPKSNFCINGTFTNDHPHCSRFCPSEDLNGITFTASCKYQSLTVPCNQILLPGTQTTLSCAIGYEKPDFDPPRPDIIVCQEDGSWDFKPFPCVQDCGKVWISPKPFVANGEVINNTLVPWNVGIYRFREPNEVSHICGGTIINAKLVISAAHCFWDQILSKPASPERYQIAAGKYLREYDAEEHTKVQKFHVQEIFIPDGYRDAGNNYHADIAILLIKGYIEFYTHIRPICLKYDLKWRSDKKLPSNTEGRVAGWGRDEDGLQTTELHVADLRVIDYEQCEKNLRRELFDQIGDKYCVGSANYSESAVCEGDSGAGFVVPENRNDITRYYLWGIVSVGLAEKGRKCGTDYYTAFTNVQLHIDEISEFEIKHRPR